MRKSNLRTKLVPLFGLAAIAGILASLAYSATAFVPSIPTVIGYIAQPELSTNNLATGKGLVFRGEYEKGGWSGNLSCYPISATGVVNLAGSCWSSGTGATLRTGAQAKVDLQGFADGSRNIATLNKTGQPVAFTLAADSTNLVDAAHVNFIRGDRGQEAPTGALRTRLSALGDSVHSRPIYIDDGKGTPTVFYGANDGMLHAIDADPVTGGKERWAYIPSMLVPKLNKLWAANYVHEYYVDGGVNVRNVGTFATPQNILVGSLGAGGQGIYALDVTSMTANSDAQVAQKFLWEITPSSITTTAGRMASTVYANMGDNITTSTMYPLENGTEAVIVGNGYNNTGNGHATLLVINTKTGALIREIDTGVAGVSGPNGLSSPAVVDNNNDGKADTAYAGDIDGNMWKFNMLDTSPANWTVSLLYSTKANPATPAGQAITMMPSVVARPNGGGNMVTFATGRLFTTADAADAATHYAYGVWDGADPSNVTMVNQTINVRNYLPAVGANPIPVRVIGTKPADAAIVPNWSKGGDKGWITKLPVAGERVTGDSAFIQNGLFFFNATNPLVKYTPTGWPANSGSGENWLMELDCMTGGAPAAPFFDMNGDGSVTDADRVQYGAGDIIPTPSVSGDPIKTGFGIPIGLMSSNGVQSQPILGNGGYFSALFYNQNSDVQPAPAGTVTPPGAVGIGGGHFDVESFYHTTNNSAATSTRSSTVGVAADFAHKKHDHEYDKIWNVNGVNLLNPSNKAAPPAHWLGESVNATTPYKVLVFNQAWNRSVELKIGAGSWVSTKDYQTQGIAAVLAGLQTYTGNTETITTVTPPAGPQTTLGTGTITSLQLRMPYNAFAINDWWGDGVKINGLIPLDSSCVKGNAVPAGNGFSLATPLAVTTAIGTDNERNPFIGVNGERHDGALTIQVIRADTPAASIVLNVAADVTINGVVVPKEKFGYRVRNTDINKYVMHEESVFWHHDVAPCMSGVKPGTVTTATPSKIPARTELAAKTGTPASCSDGSAVIPADPLTCKIIGGKPVYTPESCKTGTYTAATPSYPLYPATNAISGWTAAMPLDRADSVKNVKPNPTPRPCGTNDPHNASFTPAVNVIGGGGGGVTPPPPAPTTYPANIIGGTSSKVTILVPCGGAGQPACPAPTCGEVGQPKCDNSNCGGKGQPACSPPCVGPNCNKCAVGDPLCNPPPILNKTGRLSWHELIGQ